MRKGIDPEFASVHAVNEANAEAANNYGAELSYNQEENLQRAVEALRPPPSMMNKRSFIAFMRLACIFPLSKKAQCALLLL